MKIVLAIVIAIVAWPGAARAYHVGTKFDDPPGAGGAGGLYYTGSRRDRGWDCSSCHIEPKNRLAINVSSQPPELLAEQRYRPGTAYVITVAMANPGAQVGLAATRSNFNAIAITTLDDAGAPIGSFSGFDAGKFHLRGTSFLATETTTVNETSWTFTWTAPATSSAITIDLGVVDGNGAGQTSQMTLTDPLGDDVAMFHYVVTDAASAEIPRRARGSSWAGLWLAAPLLLLFARRRGAMLAGCRSPSSAPASSG